MFDSTRRNFLSQTAIGLATFGVSGLILRADARPTQTVSEEQSKKYPNSDGANAEGRDSNQG